MKRNLIALLLAMCILLGCSPAVYAAAGSAEDPLVSKSHAESWASALLTELVGKSKKRIEEHMTVNGGTDTASESKVLPVNSVISLDSGASVTLVSGAAKVHISKGSFINVTVGGAAINGRLLPGHKYIVCEDSLAAVTVTADAMLQLEGSYTVQATNTLPTPTPVPFMTPSPSPSPTPSPAATPSPTPTPAPTAVPTPTPVVIVIEPTPVVIYVTVTPEPTQTPAPTAEPTATPDPIHTIIPASPVITTVVKYKDVSNDAWFYNDLQFAVREDLISGTGKSQFSPAANLTVAEAVELASRLHQHLNDGEITLKDGFWLWWYTPYRKYALNNGLIDESVGNLKRKAMNAPISNGDFAEMLANVISHEEPTPLNNIPKNTIPDVKDFSPNAYAVYALYRAGILTGVTDREGIDDHSFMAHECPTRAEAAVYAARIADTDRRVEFSIDS